MNLSKIKQLDIKISKKVQRAIDKIYKEHDKELAKLIAEQVPKGCKLLSGNGMSIIVDADGNDVKKGRAWSLVEVRNSTLDRLSLLQYPREFSSGFVVPMEIKGKKTLN